MAIKRRNRLITAAGATALLLLSVCDLILGGSGIGAAEALGGLFGGEGIASSIVWSIRLPRVLTAIAAGACLALSGAQMQSVFRNPLADPHIMGVSGGAGLGAAIATLLISGTGLLSGFSSMAGLTVAGAAFAGAILASALIVLVSSRFRSGTTLLVFGVMLGFIFSAITSI
ncbi:MAG: iron chelate uptake ABC transporter family permease subunit, partial [Bacteroidales bacterium]|nr:iron chelate uptake ABC transporter family permease subunit [Bacteroidales bacterium]